MKNNNPKATKLGSSASHVPLKWNVGETILGTYKVKDVFTGGAMGDVYHVHHIDWDIDLAVKSPKPKKEVVPGSLDLFINEAETWVELGLYPHIVSCYYIRVLGRTPLIFMEYVEGGSLQEAIDQGWFYRGGAIKALESILDVAIQFSWGLKYAHDKGLVHQDIKPSNAMMTSDGIIKVTDFGMAKAKDKLERGDVLPETVPVSEDGESVLVGTTGMTPAYCSPEQAQLKSLSRKTDIFSWGVSILEMFLGKKTWRYGPRTPESFEEYLLSKERSKHIPAMPDRLVILLRHCLQSSPQDRPGSMDVICSELTSIYKQEIGRSYPRKKPQMETVLADTLNNRAVSMIDLNKKENALQLFDQALNSDTTHLHATYNRSLLLWRTGKKTDLDVGTSLGDIKKHHSDNWQFDYLTSQIHLERGDTEEVFSVVKNAVEKHPQKTGFNRIYKATKKLHRTAGRCLKVFGGFESAINSVAISCDGRYILSGGNDNQVRLWDVASGNCVIQMPGHTSPVQCVAISSDGKYGLSGGWDNEIRYWDLSNGECVRTYEAHTANVRQVIFLPDGKRTLSASSDCTLCLWNINSGEIIKTLKGHFDSVHTIDVSTDGRIAVSASFDNTIRVWNLNSFECESTLQWKRTCPSNIALSKDNRHLLLAGGDNHIYLIDLATGEPRNTFVGHSSTIKAVRFAGNGKWALSGDISGRLCLWDIGTERCLRTYQGHSSIINSISGCDDELLAATGSNDNTIRLWWLGIGKKAAYFTVLPRSSREIIELSDQIKVLLKEADVFDKRREYQKALNKVSQARSCSGYQQNPHLMNYWDRIGQKGVRSEYHSIWVINNFTTQPVIQNDIAISKDSRCAVTGGDDNTLRVWDIENEVMADQLIGHRAQIESVAISDDGKIALSGDSQGIVLVWNIDSGECIHVLSGHTSVVNSLVISQDGRVGLSASNDRTLRVWDIQEGKCKRTLKGHAHYVRCVTLTPDGKRAISIGWDKTIRVWDIDQGECMDILYGHNEPIDTMALSPDGNIVLSAGLDRTLRFWDLEKKEELMKIDDIPARTNAIAFSPAGRFALCGNQDGTISIWHTSTGSLIDTIKAHSGSINSLAVMHDGSRVVTVGDDCFLKIWRLDWGYSFPE